MGCTVLFDIRVAGNLLFGIHGVQLLNWAVAVVQIAVLQRSTYKYVANTCSYKIGRLPSWALGLFLEAQQILMVVHDFEISINRSN